MVFTDDESVTSPNPNFLSICLSYWSVAASVCPFHWSVLALLSNQGMWSGKDLWLPVCNENDKVRIDHSWID